jgi:hypothetical protein
MAPAAQAGSYYSDGPTAYVQDVSWRHSGRGGRGWGGGGYGGGYGYDDGGGLLAGGIFGLAAGAMLGNAIGGPHRYRGGSCEQRFRTFNPATGEYTGYDGLQHHCS